MSAPLRQLHVITSLGLGGAERALSRLLTGLNPRAGTAVLSLRDRGAIGADIEALGVPVYTLGVEGSVPSPLAFLRLRGLARDLQPRLLQGWMYHGNLAASLAAGRVRGEPPRVYWNVRQSLADLATEKPVTQLVIRAGARLARMTDGIVYNSRVSARQHEAIGYDASRTILIPNGVDTNRFRPDTERRLAFRRSLGVHDGHLLLGHVARYHPMKGHLNFISAVARVASRLPQIHLVLAGANVDSSNTELCRALDTAGLSRRTSVLGAVTAPEDLYPGLDALCMPSLWGEACPNVVLEGMASAVPCVVADVGDAAEMVGRPELVVAPGDAEGLAKVLVSVLGGSALERHELGNILRARAESEYSLAKMIARYRALYEGGPATGCR